MVQHAKAVPPASLRSGLPPGSAMAITWSARAPSPPVCFSHAMQHSSCVIVSAVPPDFEITMMPVRPAASRRSASRNYGGRHSPGNAAAARLSPASAYRLNPPRLDPPVPKITTSSNRCRQSAATLSSSSQVVPIFRQAQQRKTAIRVPASQAFERRRRFRHQRHEDVAAQPMRAHGIVETRFNLMAVYHGLSAYCPSPRPDAMTSPTP